MHLTHSLALTLPTLALAQSQKPLGEQVQGWFDKAKSYIPNSVPTAVKEPVGAGAAEVAAKTVTPLSISNYEEWLTPDPSSTLSPQTYMVLVTGGNKTCVGQCGKIEKAWNESVSLLAADPTAPHLGYINCDNEGPLCATWQAQPPTIWHIQRPIAKADQSAPASTVYINYLNVTTTSAKDIVALHSGQRYEEGILYEGYFQPFDGVLAQYGVNKAVGYVLYAFGLVPSWTFMLVISMVSRTFM
ncbi:hypothetical protein ACLMJK_005561 [Lecanora helva]